jgi:putative oxidoreductase
LHRGIAHDCWRLKQRAIICAAPGRSGNIAPARPVCTPNTTDSEENHVKHLIQWLIDWPESVARHLAWLAPLFARITVGWVFFWSGWGKLHNLPQIEQNFISWGIPFPHLLTPFVSGVEFFGGLFLLAGLLSRISAGALGVTMIVAIRSAKWGDVDSLETLLGFDEFEYLALFLWIAIAGAGPLSLDYWLQRRFNPRAERLVSATRA